MFNLSPAVGSELYPADIQLRYMALWLFVCGAALVWGGVFLRRSLTIRRIKARSELLESRFREVLQHSREALYSYNLQTGSFEYISPAFLRMMGMSHAEIDALSPGELPDRIHPDDLERIREMIRKLSDGAANGEWSGVVEYRLMHRDGNYHSVNDSMHVRYDASGKASVVCGAVAEITKVTLLEDSLRALEQKFQESQKMAGLGLLASGIAHDFNNLMTVILGNAELALLDCDGEGDEVLDEIKRTALRAAELATQMLVYTGKTTMVISSINLSRVVHEMAALLDVSISKKVQIEYCLNDHVQSIRGDVSQVRQVAMNLITNASDAIGDRPGVIAISINEVSLRPGELEDVFPAGSSPEGKYIRLEVSDTGCGMDESTRQKIFNPQFTTKVTGRGLGLAALLNAVERHNGAVEVKSEVGAGTVFRVYFPVEEKVEEFEVAELKDADDSWRGYGMALIADDEEAVLDVTAALLKRLGFRVLMASDGLEAVDLYSEYAGEVTFLLMDVNMPNLNGIEAVQRIRHINPSVPVLFMSGYPRDDVLSRFEQMPRIGFIKKPFRNTGLGRAVRSVLETEMDD